MKPSDKTTELAQWVVSLPPCPMSEAEERECVETITERIDAHTAETVAQARAEEREAVKGLVEALSMIESQGNSNHEDPQHADYLRKILQSVARAALATYRATQTERKG